MSMLVEKHIDMEPYKSHTTHLDTIACKILAGPRCWIWRGCNNLMGKFNGVQLEKNIWKNDEYPPLKLT